jgi:hypothetical protein
MTGFYSDIKINFMTNRIVPPYKKSFEEITKTEYDRIINSSKRKTVLKKDNKYFKI